MCLGHHVILLCVIVRLLTITYLGNKLSYRLCIELTIDFEVKHYHNRTRARVGWGREFMKGTQTEAIQSYDCSSKVETA